MKLNHGLPAFVSTNAAALILGRQPTTLRRWVWDGSGPIKPIKIHGRLGWPVSDLRKLLQQERGSHE